MSEPVRLAYVRRSVTPERTQERQAAAGRVAAESAGFEVQGILDTPLDAAMPHPEA
ncbi:hypothetical protein ACFXKX_23740 [Streptomyces scopuliridis]|uniref:hypothetical protein n=1 Tax=Streptomyces scopuliridis TaxID=452529 RepID=UPI0036C82238